MTTQATAEVAVLRAAGAQGVEEAGQIMNITDMWKLESLTPLEGFDEIYKHYATTFGRTPDAFMAKVVAETEYRLLKWWAFHREDIREALAQYDSNAASRVTAPAQAEQPADTLECTRSHPHENMDALCDLRTIIARLENEKALQAEQPAPVPCQNAASMGEHACKNRAQCWEPCGELGHSAEHARVSSRSGVGGVEPLVRQIHKLVKRGEATDDHGLIGNLHCILDHLLPDPPNFLDAAPTQGDALDQALDDMGSEGHSVCQATKDMMLAALAASRESRHDKH